MSKHATGNGNKKITTWIKATIVVLLVLMLGIAGWIALLHRSSKQKTQVQNTCVGGNELINLAITNSLKKYTTKIISNFNNSNEIVRDKCIRVNATYTSSKNLYRKAIEKSSTTPDIAIPAGIFWSNMIESQNNSIKSYNNLNDPLVVVLPRSLQKEFIDANYSWETYIRMAAEKIDFQEQKSSKSVAVKISIANSPALLNTLNFYAYKMIRMAQKDRPIGLPELKTYFLRTNTLSTEKNTTALLYKLDKYALNNKLRQGAIIYQSDFYQYKKQNPHTKLLTLTPQIGNLTTTYSLLKLRNNANLAEMESIDDFISYFLEKISYLENEGFKIYDKQYQNKDEFKPMPISASQAKLLENYLL